MRPGAANPSARGRAARSRGAAAEIVVADYLWARGFTILGTNVRVGHREIDLVARSGDLVVVVEVRHRGLGSWQGGLESLDPAKCRRVREAGERLWGHRFASDHSINRMRFDAASVEFSPDGSTLVDYIEGAF